MIEINFSKTDYEVLETQEMDNELHLKFVQFSTGYYGIITENPVKKMEEVILVSPEKGETNFDEHFITGGLGCKSYMVFARDAKNYMEKNPIELVVRLGDNDEYREVITREDSKTLYEKVNICLEIMEMKYENSFIYKYGDLIQTVLLCIILLSFIFCFLNSLRVLGVI